MSIERKRTDEDELKDFKKKLADKALKAKLANKKHRENVKLKLSSMQTTKDDERLEEVLDVVKDIQKLLQDFEPMSDDTESESESEDEDEFKPKKKKLKAISEDEDDEPKKKKVMKKVVDIPKKKVVKKKKDEDEDILEPDVVEDLQLQRKFPSLHKYPIYV